MPAPDDVPYSTAWVALRAARYRCEVCRRPTRRTVRGADGLVVVECDRPHRTPKEPKQK